MPKPVVPGAQFKLLLEDLSSYSSWVKEAIYVFLAEDLKQNVSASRLKDLAAKDSLFLYVPRLTRVGQSYFDTLKYENAPVDKRLISFINSVKNQSNMLDIAQDNGWNLSIACKYVIKAWEKNVILPTYSKNIYALVRFLAGEIDLGDFLVRLGRISKEQLNWVNTMNKTGMMALDEQEQSTYEDIFVNLGYITTDELMFYKNLVSFANEKSVFSNPGAILIQKVQELQTKSSRLEEKSVYLEEEKKELQRKIDRLNVDLQSQKNENIQYSKEIELLKDELKKALKG
ncbi:MAG: hypothetical protein AB7V50_04510 [Vampirovibrionia bacterium]